MPDSASLSMGGEASPDPDVLKLVETVVTVSRTSNASLSYERTDTYVTSCPSGALVYVRLMDGSLMPMQIIAAREFRRGVLRVKEVLKIETTRPTQVREDAVRRCAGCQALCFVLTYGQESYQRCCL